MSNEQLPLSETSDETTSFEREEIQLVIKAVWMAAVKYATLAESANSTRVTPPTRGLPLTYWAQKHEEMVTLLEKLRGLTNQRLIEPPF
jgi:hypothetical protein